MAESINTALQRMKRSATMNGGQALVSDWRKQIPDWSHWFPGCPGDPFCEKCLGTGYVRLDVEIEHPMFGKILFCDCVPQNKIAQHEAHLQARGGKA